MRCNAKSAISSCSWTRPLERPTFLGAPKPHSPRFWTRGKVEVCSGHFAAKLLFRTASALVKKPAQMIQDFLLPICLALLELTVWPKSWSSVNEYLERQGLSNLFLLQPFSILQGRTARITFICMYVCMYECIYVSIYLSIYLSIYQSINQMPISLGCPRPCLMTLEVSKCFFSHLRKTLNRHYEPPLIITTNN